MQGFLSHPQRQSYVPLSPGYARSMDARNCKPTENQIQYMFYNYAFYILTLLDHDQCAYAYSGNEGSRLPLPQRKKIFDTYNQGDCTKSFCLYVPYNDVHIGIDFLHEREYTLACSGYTSILLLVYS